MKRNQKVKQDNNENMTNEPTSFRSPHSDVEVPEIAQTTQPTGHGIDGKFSEQAGPFGGD